MIKATIEYTDGRIRSCETDSLRGVVRWVGEVAEYEKEEFGKNLERTTV